MEQEHGIEILGKHPSLELIFIIMVNLFLWGMSVFVFLSDSGTMNAIERIVIFACFSPVLILWVCLAVIGFKEHLRKQNRINDLGENV